MFVNTGALKNKVPEELRKQAFRSLLQQTYRESLKTTPPNKK